MLSAASKSRKSQPIVERRGPRRSKINKSLGEQLSLVEDQGLPPEAEPPQRKRGRPSNAELAARAAAQEGKKERKSPERLTEEQRTERYFRVSLEFPHPTIFTPKQALERFPELDYVQNAYGFLKSAAKRGFVENLGNGQFRFTESASEELQNSVGPSAAQPQASPAPAAKPRPTISLRKEPLAASAPEPTSIAAPAEAPAAVPIASAPAPIPAPTPDAEPRRALAESPTSIAYPPAEPMAPHVARSEADRVGALLQLSRRYRSERYYNVDDLIVPMRECWAVVYGDVEINIAEPPVCVVVDAYEPDPKAVNPFDIDVMFLDMKDQHHIRSAASWMFVPYQKE